MKFVAIGNTMRDSVAQADGTITASHMGGPSPFAYAGIRVWCDDVQMLTGMGFQQAAPLILLLTGCLISAFGALGFILHGTKERLKTNFIIVGIGFVLVVTALIYGGIYEKHIESFGSHAGSLPCFHSLRSSC